MIKPLDDRIMVMPIKSEKRLESGLYLPDMNSEIRAIPHGGEAIRSWTATAVFTDELAFQEDAEDAIRAALPTIGKKGRLTAVSTANGENYWYELVADKLRRT